MHEHKIMNTNNDISFCFRGPSAGWKDDGSRGITNGEKGAFLRERGTLVSDFSGGSFVMGDDLSTPMHGEGGRRRRRRRRRIRLGQEEEEGEEEITKAALMYKMFCTLQSIMENFLSFYSIFSLLEQKL